MHRLLSCFSQRCPHQHACIWVQVIAEKMMEYLRSVTDDTQKLDAVMRIHELAERFAPDTQWFLDIMTQVPLCLYCGWKADCSIRSLIFAAEGDMVWTSALLGWLQP